MTGRSYITVALTIPQWRPVSAAEVALAAEFTTPRWYAAQTCSRHEKRVSEYLGSRSIESFLPLYTTQRRWADRKARVELPLFPGYLFVRIPLAERLRVLDLP
ncbi:MAG TPA: transcription termination/antitermination NusG family protein, partial [Terriglobales bacterium]|nr:transcription termination/antitermination NusG family protein [Terriglobales bacterium]